MIKIGSPRFVALIVLLAAILLSASGCFSPYTGEAGEGGNLVIQLGEAGTSNAISRAVSLTPETKNQLVHTITVSGGPGIPQVKTGVTLGQRVVFSVLPGTWNISVKGYLGDVLRAEDTLETGVAITAGTNAVPITMQAYAPGLYQKNADGGYTTGFDSPLDTTLDVAVTLVGDSPGYDFVYLLSETTTSNFLNLNSPGSTLTLQGYDKGHELAYSGFGSLFIIEGNTELILDNITLSGRTDNIAPLVSVSGGALTMKEDSVITGNGNTGNGGGVTVENFAPYTGTFNMDGGSIHTNEATSGGGVYVTSGTFTMTGGTISGNKSTVSGGGVYVAAGTFTMTGGTISGNTANISDTSGLGGGVYVDSASGGIFTKTGGIIYGFEVPANNKNYVYASGGGPPATGNAVFVQGLLSVRNYTAYETDNLDSTVSGTPGGWD